ncbi:hypothetical protein TrRE_jg4083, partial [Triparma retinervis]
KGLPSNLSLTVGKDGSLFYPCKGYTRMGKEKQDDKNARLSGISETLRELCEDYPPAERDPRKHKKQKTADNSDKPASKAGEDA